MSGTDVRTRKVRRASVVRLVVAAALATAAAVAVGPQPAGAAMGDISRFAGTYASGFGIDGTPAASAELNGPTGVDVAADGRVFIADRANGAIRVVGTDGTIDTLVSGLFSPIDIAVSDADGVLYVVEEGAFVDRISRIDISGGPTTPAIIAGGGAPGYAGDGGPAANAVFNSLGGIDVAPDGDVVIADRGNNRIRRIDVDTMTISLVAGTGVAGGDDGPVASATFAGPKDVAVAPDGTIYVADEITNNVRRIAAGQVTRFAGDFGPGSFGGDGGAATSALLNSPDGVAVGPDGAVYIADTGNNRVRRVDPDSGIITTVAGNGLCCATGDGGPATAASVGTPTRIALDAAGALYIAAELEHAIRLVEGPSVPGPPLNLVATVVDGDVVLEWDPPADDGGAPVTAYNVYRDGVLVATLTGPTFALTFTEPAVDGVSTYEVTAVNLAGEGPPSEPVDVVVEAPTTTSTSAPVEPRPPQPPRPVVADPSFVG